MGRRVTVYVDQRYVGRHGIARYAQEVLGRLDLPVQSLPVGKEPTSPAAVTERGWRIPRADDLIYSPGFGAGWAKAPVFLTVHDLIHLQVGAGGAKAVAHRLYYERVVKPTIKRAGHVFTVSETSAEAIRQWLDDEGVEIHNTGNGCSEAFTTQGPAHRRERPYVLAVSNVKPHKNPRAIVETMRHLPDLDLVIVTGDVADFRALAQEAGVVDRTSVISGLDDRRLASYYRGAVAVLFPSLLEGFGLPALESVACGTPVVHFAGCRAVAEIVDAECLSSPNRPEEYAARIQTLSEGRLPAIRQVTRSWDSVAGVVADVLRQHRA